MLMNPNLTLPYLWVPVVLVFSEGLSAAGNIIVMTVMAKHLPPEQRKEALSYGLLGAFVFRFLALFLVSIIANFWFIQAAGAIYLIYVSIKNLWQFFKRPEIESPEAGDDHYYDEPGEEIKASSKSFWGTMLKIEFTDIAFVVDSMLAVFAIAIILPKVGIHFGGMGLGQFVVVFLDRAIGVILMCCAAIWFVELSNRYLGFEGAAFAIVGWVGVKLTIMVLAHPDIVVLPEYFPHGTLRQSTFWTVLVGLVIIGWLGSVVKNKKSHRQMMWGGQF